METQVWLPKTRTQISNLHDEVIFQICSEMPMNDLISFVKSNSKLYQICNKILEQRRKFKKRIKDQIIIFLKDLDGILSSAYIKNSGYQEYLEEGSIIRINDDRLVSSIKIIKTENGAVAMGESLIQSLNPDFRNKIHFLDGYIILDENPSINLTFRDGIPLFDLVPNTESIELTGYTELLNFIFHGDPNIEKLNENDLTDVIKFTYHYDSRTNTYTFIELFIPLTDRNIIYSNLEDGTYTREIFYTKNHELDSKILTKEELEYETRFTLELKPFGKRIFIPGSDSEVIFKKLFELSVFIDLYPISFFLNILK